MADLDLPVLEPPPGGLEALRGRIAADEQKRARRWWLAVPVVAAAAVALWLVVARAPAPGSLAPHAIATAAPLLADPSVGADFYWVAPVPVAPHPSSPQFVDISAVSIAP